MLPIAQPAQALARVHSFKAKLSAQHYSRKHTRHQLQTYAAVSSSSDVACSTAVCILQRRNALERSWAAAGAKHYTPLNSSSSVPQYQYQYLYLTYLQEGAHCCASWTYLVSSGT